MAIVSDEALLAGVAVGDEAAARAFVRRHQQRVFGLATTILGDRFEAGDVAQEAFVRAWRHAAAFDPRRGSATTWLLAITRNAAIDALRLRRALPTEPQVLTALLGTSGEVGPDHLAVAGSELERVRMALADLPPEQRRAVLLAAFLGRTAAEVADQEAIPLGTAKTRIRSGLRRVRDRMAEEALP